jgi:hypothetical protein
MKLKDAVQRHGGNNWITIAALVPGRTHGQCLDRWKHVLDPNIDRANGHPGKWAEYDDIKLKDSVQAYGGKNGGAIAALVPGRTKKQCWNRWKHVLDPNIDRAIGRTGKWIEDEGSKLYKRTVARIGVQLPRWFPIELKNSAMADGPMFWLPASTGRTGKWADE